MEFEYLWGNYCGAVSFRDVNVFHPLLQGKRCAPYSQQQITAYSNLTCLICCRMSFVVTGPSRWIHGSPNQCEIINKKDRGFINKQRAWSSSGSWKTIAKGIKVITSNVEMKNAVYPNVAPILDWDDNNNRPSTGLFWTVWFIWFVHSILIINKCSWTIKLCENLENCWTTIW